MWHPWYTAIHSLKLLRLGVLRESEVAATQYQVGTAFFLVGLSYMLASLPAGAVSEKQSTSTGRI